MDDAEIAGMKPAAGKGRRARPLVFQVALHHDIAAEHHLAERFAVGGEKRVWTDLQLPLYLDALAGEVGTDAVGGYFNLPKAVGETAVSTWEGYDSGWRAAARRCAESAAAAIVAGVFWPPAEVDGDDEPFSGFFHQGTAASVDPVFAREAAAQ